MAKFDPDAYLGGTVTQEADKKKRGGFDPDAYLAAPTQPQPKDRGFTAPLKEMSVEDWKKESLAYPVLQTMYGLLPFQGKQGEQAFTEGMAGVKQKGDKIVEGVKTIAQDPAAAAQAAWTAITERPQETLGQMVKGAIYDPELLFVPVPGAKQVGQAASATGRAVAGAVKPVVQAPFDVVKGAVGRGTGYIAEPGVIPKGYQVPSSRVPLGETYYPAEGLAQLKQNPNMLPGDLPPAIGEQPIKNLAPGPVIALSGGEVPMAGKTAQAFGERLGETYRNPITAAIDIGSFGLTGVPWYTTAKGGLAAAQGVADYILGRKGFEALSNEQRAALAKGQNPWASGSIPPSSGMGGGGGFPSTPPLPLLPYTPAGESPINMGGPGRRVNIEGESYNLPYDINTSNAQTARPQPNVGPTAEQLAAQQAAERARISEANKLRVAQQLEEQRNPPQPAPTEIPDTSVKPTPMPEDIVAPAPEVVAQPKQQRPMTAAEIRRKLPFIPGESEAAFEARVQAVLQARPMVDVEAPPAPKETGKRSYVRQEDRIREAEAKLTAEERAAQEAEVERQLAKSRGKPMAGKPATKETVSTESLKAKMSTPEQTAMDEATRARLEQLGLLGKKKTPPKDTMGMMTESQIAFKQQEMVDKLGNRPTYGDYIDAQGNKIVYSERYPGVSDEVKARLSDADQPIIQKFNPQGERIPMGEDWSATDPAPRKVLVEKRLGKEPYEVIWDQNGDVIKESGRLNKPFKHDKSITITRVQEYLNPMEGEGGIIFEATGRSKAGEDVRIVQYNDGQLIGIFEKNGKDRVVKYK